MTDKTKAETGRRIIARRGRPHGNKRWGVPEPSEFVIVRDYYYKYPESRRYGTDLQWEVDRNPDQSIVYAQPGGSYLAVRPAGDEEVRHRVKVQRATVRHRYGRRYEYRQVTDEVLPADKVDDLVAKAHEAHEAVVAEYREAQDKYGTERYPDVDWLDKPCVVEVEEGCDWFWLVAQSNVVSDDPEAYRKAQREAAEARKARAEENDARKAENEERLKYAALLLADLPEGPLRRVLATCIGGMHTDRQGYVTYGNYGVRPTPTDVLDAVHDLTVPDAPLTMDEELEETLRRA